jgi:D-alanyl-D-alanine-carboxypeptidase/D-alanyl-D-alanine-endopeptidase
LRFHLDLGKTPASCSFDSLDQDAMDIPCNQVLVSPTALSLAVPMIHGSLTGPISADGNTVFAAWAQGGGEMTLTLTRQGVAPTSSPLASTPSVNQAARPSMSGVWLGTLRPGGKRRLRLQIQLDLTQTSPSCSFVSLDQMGTVIPCDNVVVSSTSLSLNVPQIGGGLSGPISADGNTVYASWRQGGAELSLVMTRHSAAIEPPKAATDPAMPPVPVEQIQAAMDKDLAAALATGELAPVTGEGVTIGVVVHGARRIFTYGAAKPDSVYEIGSITKTFTGLILAQMVEQKKARLDEPVRALLPPGTVGAPASGAEIALVDLSAQRSGLPRIPENMHPADPADPYAGYDAKALYAFVASHGVGMPSKPRFEYSNLGVGLLGAALAQRAGSSYEALLHAEVTGPLGMRDTAVTLTPAMRERLAPGHDGAHHVAKPWDFDALVGCGGIRSTAADMLTYLEAQLHPDQLPASSRARGEGKTLPAAITASHALQGEAGQGQHIALNWFRTDETGSYWHGGATGGYSAFSLFNPEKDVAVVVLSNSSVGEEGDFADDLGRHVVQRLTGRPAVSLAPAPH